MFGYRFRWSNVPVFYSYYYDSETCYIPESVWCSYPVLWISSVKHSTHGMIVWVSCEIQFQLILFIIVAPFTSDMDTNSNKTQQSLCETISVWLYIFALNSRDHVGPPLITTNQNSEAPWYKSRMRNKNIHVGPGMPVIMETVNA